MSIKVARFSLSILLPIIYLVIGAVVGYKVQEASNIKSQQRMEEKIKEIERDRREERDRIVAEAKENVKEVERQRVIAESAADRLRNEIHRLRDSASSCGGEGDGSGNSVDMLAFVSGRIDEASGELAEYADRLLAAGLSCEDVFSSLR